MRIAIVHSKYGSREPSGENFVVELQAKSLKDYGHEVLVLNASTDELLSEPFYKSRAFFRVIFGRGRSPLRQIRLFKPDIVHVHNLFPNYSTNWLNRLKIPVVITIHNFRYFCAQGSFLKNGHFCQNCIKHNSLEAIKNKCYRNSYIASIPLAFATRSRGTKNEILRKSNAIIVLSPKVKEVLSELVDLELQKKIHLVPNFYKPAEENFEINELRNYWVYAGRLTASKGIVELINHWPPEIQLLVLGEGSERDNLMRISQGKKIQFFGKTSPSKVFEILKGSLGLVVPSYSESAPSVVYMQALAANVPTIALKDSAVGQDVKLHKTGWIVESIEEIVHIVNQYSNYSFNPQNVKKRAHELSDGEWVRNMMKIYESLLKS